MLRVKRPVGGWLVAAFVVGAAWACSSENTPFFEDAPRGGQSTTGGASTGGGGAAGSSSGSPSGGSPTGGAGGASTGGASGGMPPTGGTTGEGGAAADSGRDSGGTTMGGMSGAGGTPGAGKGGMGGNAGTPAMGGAGMGGAGMGGAGVGGAGMGGAGMGGAGRAGSGGAPGECKTDDNCATGEYCKKATCAAETGLCEERGPECLGATAVFGPVCGCDGITYWNTCVIEHEGFNVAMAGECAGNNRPTCTRDEGGDSCPERLHAHCYRPVAVCGVDPSPATGVCWVLPTECPDNEPQTERYCGGTDPGGARCIGLCEVLADENSFRRDAPPCAGN